VTSHGAPPDDLNEPQLEAVTHAEGPLLVFAGAGSGKTRVITFRIANLVATHGVPPYRILAVTFTNKAAGEMRERLDGLLGHDLARDLWVGTFHATCAKLLRKHHEAVGFSRSFVIYDDADQRALMDRIVKERDVDTDELPARTVLARIHAWKQEAIPPEDVPRNTRRDDLIVSLYEEYEKRLRAADACDFDDLLLHVLRLVELEEPSTREHGGARTLAGAAIRAQFRYVLVDEFQDTNAVQYRLVRALVRATGNLAVVGDDDQSIYRWRGADVRNIRGFAKDFPGAHVVKLEQNYRSTSRIVRAALAVIAKGRERVPKELWTANDAGEPIELRSTIDERDEAQQVAAYVDARQAEGVSRKDMAVLYRTHAQSRVLEEALRARRIPYKIVGGLRFFDRAEVKDLLAYLRLCANPKSDVDLARIVNVPARGIGATTVDRVQQAARTHGLSALQAMREVARGKIEAGVAAAARKRLLGFLSIVDELAHAAEAGHPPSELAELALERSGYADHLREDRSDEAEARLQNLGELVGSIREYEAMAQAAGEVASIAGFLERTALVTTGDEQKGQDPLARGGAQPDDVLTLMSVHAAKGLEFREVMITGLEEDLFPFVRARDEDDAVFGPTGLTRGEEALEEERRLAYVAITRARERLLLFHAGHRTLFGQLRYGRPSRFLVDLPREDLRQRLPGASAEARPSGWGSARRYDDEGPRQAWRHPMSGGSSGGSSAPRARAPEPVRAPGERYVERDEHAHHDFDEHDGHRDEGGCDLRRGDRVRHKRFGVGRVLSIEEGAEPKILAEFSGFGEVTILRRFLEPVR
jgi:DNA helicase-2/ATP-dependent DNA helicase PcrA